MGQSFKPALADDAADQHVAEDPDQKDDSLDAGADDGVRRREVLLLAARQVGDGDDVVGPGRLQRTDSGVRIDRHVPAVDDERRDVAADADVDVDVKVEDVEAFVRHFLRVRFLSSKNQIFTSSSKPNQILKKNFER